jgi:hypothetical protein
MSQLSIEIDEHRTEFHPGETISVLIEWSMPTEPESIELHAVWNTVGKGTRDMGIEHSIVIDSPGRSDSRWVEFPLPGAPYSFSGKLISLVWALELVAQPSEESARTEITIAPEGSEILLTAPDEGRVTHADGDSNFEDES